MYNPLSFNVIRQALAWANLPPPRLSRESKYKLPDGTMTAIYSAEFDYSEVQLWLDRHYGHLAGRDWFFQQSVCGCFCQDITTLDREIDEPSGVFIVYLHIRVPPRTDIGVSEIPF